MAGELEVHASGKTVLQDRECGSGCWAGLDAHKTHFFHSCRVGQQNMERTIESVNVSLWTRVCRLQSELPVLIVLTRWIKPPQPVSTSPSQGGTFSLYIIYL